MSKNTTPTTPVQFTREQAKAGARALQRHIRAKQEQGVPLDKLATVYDMLAVAAGYADWNTMSARITKSVESTGPRTVSLAVDEQFECLSAEQLIALMRARMAGPSGGSTDGDFGNFFQDRAFALVAPLLHALVYLRESGRLRLSVDTVRDVLRLENLVDIGSQGDPKQARFKGLPYRLKAPIRDYLDSLPGLPEDMDMAQKQHGFVIMALHAALASWGTVVYPTPTYDSLQIGRGRDR